MERFRYRKITPEMRLEMVELRAQGNSLKNIAADFDINVNTVIYHISEKERLRTIKRATKCNRKKSKEYYHEKNKAAREYKAEWTKDRYHNDEIFRKKMIRANSGGTYKD